MNNKNNYYNPYNAGYPQNQNYNQGYSQQYPQFNYVDLPPYLRNHPEMAPQYMSGFNNQGYYPENAYVAYPENNYYDNSYNQAYSNDPYQAIVNQPTIDLPLGKTEYPDFEAPKTVGSTYKSSIAPKGSLVCLSGMYKGFDFPIKHQETIVLGTNSSVANIVISENSNYVSKKHCTVIYDAANTNYIVIDHSTNGTYLQNGLKLTRGVPKRLEKGAIIYLANSDNSFKLS